MAYAQRVYDATPPLSGALEVDVIAIRTAARMDVEVLRRGTALWPPFRCPHHTVSAAAMCGTLLHGWKLTPGEVSLAHGGILALDGIEDFSHAALTMVWRAVTDGDITISGPNETRVRVPARFQLIARVAPQSELGTRELIPEALHNQVTLLNEQDLAEALV
jgi:magnesium chelatase family protein